MQVLCNAAHISVRLKFACVVWSCERTVQWSPLILVATAVLKEGSGENQLDHLSFFVTRNLLDLKFSSKCTFISFSFKKKKILLWVNFCQKTVNSCFPDVLHSDAVTLWLWSIQKRQQHKDTFQSDALTKCRCRAITMLLQKLVCVWKGTSLLSSPLLDSAMTSEECERARDTYTSVVAVIPTNCLAICFHADTALKFQSHCVND